MQKTAKRHTAIKPSKGDRIFQGIVVAVMIVILIVVIYPLVYVLSASVSDPYKVQSGEMWLYPVGLTSEAYERLFAYGEIWSGYLNTIYYTVAGTLLGLTVTLPAAYAMSRKEFVGRGLLTVMVMITMFFSGGLIPTYLNIKNLGLLNSQFLMILTGATSAYYLIVSRTFFAGLPNELIESSKIDGASNFRLFVQIVLPLSKPIIAVMAMYIGVAHWNDYMTALIYLQNRAYFPLQLILREILIQNQVTSELIQSIDEAAVAAEMARVSQLLKFSSIIVSSLPLLIMYPFMQRFFIKGVMIGAVKG